MRDSVSTYLLPSGDKLEITQEWVNIYSNSPRPDPKWRVTDLVGHEHYYKDGYPTLKTVVDETYWCADCRDEHDREHLECIECGEHIKPKTIGPSYLPQRIPGPRYATLNGFPISNEEANIVAAEAQQAAKVQQREQDLNEAASALARLKGITKDEAKAVVMSLVEDV